MAEPERLPKPTSGLPASAGAPPKRERGRGERLARALRDNLKKRKAQARARDAAAGARPPRQGDEPG